MVVLNIWSFNAFYIFQIPYLLFLFVLVITVLYWLDKRISTDTTRCKFSSRLICKYQYKGTTLSCFCVCLLWLCCMCRRLMAIFLYWRYVYFVFISKLDTILPNKAAVKETEIIEIIDTKLSFEPTQQNPKQSFMDTIKAADIK